MSYSFEYIDIILLAMIAGFIFLRLRGILGKRTGFEGKAPSQLKEVLKTVNKNHPKKNDNFDDNAQKEFLKGAKIAYETVITDFSDNDNKITTSKSLLCNFSVLFIKLCQSFLSLSEILLFNYVNILTSCQFGFDEVVSREKIHVS